MNYKYINLLVQWIWRSAWVVHFMLFRTNSWLFSFNWESQCLPCRKNHATFQPYNFSVNVVLKIIVINYNAFIFCLKFIRNYTWGIVSQCMHVSVSSQGARLGSLGSGKRMLLRANDSWRSWICWLAHNPRWEKEFTFSCVLGFNGVKVLHGRKPWYMWGHHCLKIPNKTR